MNERIKELAKQALEETQLMMIMEYKNFESKLYEKFAKLIICECAIACEQNSWIALTAYQRSQQIKQHFEVTQ